MGQQGIVQDEENVIGGFVIPWLVFKYPTTPPLHNDDVNEIYIGNFLNFIYLFLVTFTISLII